MRFFFFENDPSIKAVLHIYSCFDMDPIKSHFYTIPIVAKLKVELQEPVLRLTIVFIPTYSKAFTLSACLYTVPYILPHIVWRLVVSGEDCVHILQSCLCCSLCCCCHKWTFIFLCTTCQENFSKLMYNRQYNTGYKL